MRFEEKVLATILESVQSYAKLCEFIYVIPSNKFRKQDYYALHFYPQNFLISQVLGQL